MIPALSMIIDEVTGMALAYALALPIAWNRERETRTAGLRTFPIVAVASCGLAMLGMSLSVGGSDGATRVLQGLVTGIGFVGGGAIVQAKNRVTGTATAASVWCVGIIGAAVGFGKWDIAVVLSVVNFLTLKLLTPLKKDLESGKQAPDE